MLTLESGEYLGGSLRHAPLFDSSMALTSYPSGCRYPWHTHENPTLFVLLSGEHHDESGLASFDQPLLSVVYHPTTVPHATSVGPGGMVGINVELTDALLDECQLCPRDLVRESRVLDSLHARLLALRLAALAYASGPSGAKAEVEDVALELAACLITSPSPPASSPRWLPRVEEYLRAHWDRPVRLRDVAAEVGIHPVYCARAFRRTVGCTVTAYLRALRLLRAGELLLNDRHSLAEVALRVGCADQAHFTRMCSRGLGTTPGRLQRMGREYLPTAGCNRSRRVGGRAVVSSGS